MCLRLVQPFPTPHPPPPKRKGLCCYDRLHANYSTGPNPPVAEATAAAVVEKEEEEQTSCTLHAYAAPSLSTTGDDDDATGRRKNGSNEDTTELVQCRGWPPAGANCSSTVTTKPASVAESLLLMAAALFLLTAQVSMKDSFLGNAADCKSFQRKRPLTPVRDTVNGMAVVAAAAAAAPAPAAAVASIIKPSAGPLRKNMLTGCGRQRKRKG